MKKKPTKNEFPISDQVVKAGESLTLELQVARLYTHTP